MRRVVRFYQNKQGIDFGVRFEDILKWSDYQFQVREKYLLWLFPLEDDPQQTRLTPGLRQKFQTNIEMRKKVIRIVVRYMSFLGYTVKLKNERPIDVVRIKPLLREEGNVIIGLYNKDNYPRITRILTFLNIIRMKELGSFLFLILCRAMQSKPDLKHLIDTEMVFQEWLKTQSYLKERRYEAQEAILDEEMESWEKSLSEEEIETILNDAWE